ncbi:MAG: hypothetical protein WC819_02055 [Parcubacteria group bacterium]|jgi:hypothetical protein
MLDRLRTFLDEKTNGIIQSKQEVIYLFLVVILAIVLIFNLMYHMSV